MEQMPTTCIRREELAPPKAFRRLPRSLVPTRLTYATTHTQLRGVMPHNKPCPPLNTPWPRQENWTSGRQTRRARGVCLRLNYRQEMIRCPCEGRVRRFGADCGGPKELTGFLVYECQTRVDPLIRIMAKRGKKAAWGCLSLLAYLWFR